MCLKTGYVYLGGIFKHSQRSMAIHWDILWRIFWIGISLWGIFWIHWDILWGIFWIHWDILSGIFTSLRDGNRPHRIVTANDVGHWDQKHPKVLIVGKKNAKNLIAMYSGPTQFKKITKNMKKRRNCCYLQCFCAVRSRNHCKYHGFWGSGGQKHCKTNVKKHWYSSERTLSVPWVP